MLSISRYSSKRTLDYFEGNFEAFRKARRITSDEEAEAILLGRHNFDNDVDPEADRSPKNVARAAWAARDAGMP
jgi:hypothetical protein